MTRERWMDRPVTGHWLDVDSWSRRETYEFFKAYEQPMTNVCATVDVTAIHAFCRRSGTSFFLASWFLALQAVCSVKNLRMRLRGDRVFVHDRLYLSTTVLRDDESFGFCHVPCVDSFLEFVALGEKAIQATHSRSLPLSILEGRDDAVYGTTLPWVQLTGITHAHRIPAQSSVPKLVFGKYGTAGDEVRMPVAIEVHHALCDGLHVARFYQELEQRLQAPEQYLGQ